MSLDVTLYGKSKMVRCTCSKCQHEHEREEIECLFEANITHNLNVMACKAGIYKHLWRPDELGITKAKDLIIPLARGIADMKARPGYYQQFNSPNGWGLYINFVPWIEEYLEACKNYPDAEISISR